MTTPGDLWRLLKYSRAVVVDSREALDAAMLRGPRYIVVEGSEALRAYAAGLAYRGGQEAARLEAAALPADGPAYMILPTVGRIRDGYRQHDQAARRPRPGKLRRLPAGMGIVLVACFGLAAALLGEWLSYPGAEPRMVRGPHREALPGRGSQALPLPTAAPSESLYAIVMQVMSIGLLLLGAAALGYLIWQAVRPGRAARVSWRVEHRVQGRLVIARIRTAIA